MRGPCRHRCHPCIHPSDESRAARPPSAALLCWRSTECALMWPAPPTCTACIRPCVAFASALQQVVIAAATKHTRIRHPTLQAAASVRSMRAEHAAGGRSAGGCLVCRRLTRRFACVRGFY
jgi:hypothetical protein